MSNLLGSIASFFYFFALLLLATKIRNTEYSRKFVHIMLGNWWFLVIFMYEDIRYAAITPFVFIFINYFSLKKGNVLLKGLERESKKSYGLILYPIALVIMVFVSYYANKPYLGGVGVMALAYGDGFASIIGLRFPYGKYQVFGNAKTLAGSLSMFLFSFLSICLLLNFSGTDITIFAIFITCLAAAAAEGITPLGCDNLSIPVVSVIVYAAVMF